MRRVDRRQSARRFRSPGDSPTRATVPFRRASLSACENVLGEGPVTRTSCAPSARRLQDLVNRLRRACIDRNYGTGLFGQCELFWGNIDGRDMQAHSLGILDCEMDEAFTCLKDRYTCREVRRELSWPVLRARLATRSRPARQCCHLG